jgi:hypothetical protein
MSDEHSRPSSPPRPGWVPLPEERLPRPNYFPAGMAMGTAFMFWGVITSYVVFFIGVGLFVAALAGWISEIRHDGKKR